MKSTTCLHPKLPLRKRGVERAKLKFKNYFPDQDEEPFHRRPNKAHGFAIYLHLSRQNCISEWALEVHSQRISRITVYT